VEKGPMVDGKHHGQWELRLADGTVSEGPFVRGRRHGHWVVWFTNGNIAEGSMVGGEQHGQWVSRRPDGAEVITNWHHGEIVE